MKILFITYDFPYPTNSGGKNRAYHLLKHTAKKADISLFSFVRDDYSADFNKEIYSLNVKDIKVFKRKKLLSLDNIPGSIFTSSSIFKNLYFDKEVNDSIISYVKDNKIDIVHFESSYTGYYISNELKRLHVKQVLGTENIEYMLYEDLAKFNRKIYLKPLIKIQAGRLKDEELLMVKNADRVTTITEGEANILEDLTSKKCDIVANGIEPDFYSYNLDKKIKKNILFVGNFTYFPNVDAIDFFLDSVFPMLSKDLTLTIIGKNCTKVVKNDDKRIIKKDFVENIIDEYRNADILVFPIRIGGGTNFKVLEAMSLGVPIIAQPERLSGLRAVEGTHFLKATNGSEYNGQIKRIYEDNNLRESLAKNSRELIDKYYSWENIGRDLLNVWKS